MKVGFNLLLWTAHVEREHEPLFGRLRELGYDGVEVPVMRGDVARYAALGRAIRDAGLACTCSTAMPGPHADPIAADATVRRAGRDHLRWCIDSAAALGAGVLCGPTYQALGRFTGTGPTEREQAWAIEAHRAAADHAAAAGVVVATEFLNRFECYFLNTLEAAAAHARAVDRPAFGVHYDTFHANIEESDPVGALARHVDAVRHVHLAENHRGTPGTGHVDFAGTLAALRAGGYDGWVVVEAFGRALPELAAATCIWRDLFPDRDAVPADAIRLIRRLLAG
ncbi:MAG: sugar phosphate isomerase/epimerase [Planctomycetes bacterium]|nr:sugar phosphate isomerase/epimerase [Planctomycetota bacterium]